MNLLRLALFPLETGDSLFIKLLLLIIIIAKMIKSSYSCRKENALDADYVKIVINSSQPNDFTAVDAYQVNWHDDNDCKYNVHKNLTNIMWTIFQFLERWVRLRPLGRPLRRHCSETWRTGDLVFRKEFYTFSIVFSCPGSSIPDLGHWLGATLEFPHKEWFLRLETLQTFDRSDELRRKSWKKVFKK